MSSGVAAAAENWLDNYIHHVSSRPALSAEDEHWLVSRLHGADRNAMIEKLVSAHLRFVVNIARDYLKYRQPLADLIAEGNVGLIEAVRQFDPKAGQRLLSSAGHWINASIAEFVLNNWSIVNPGLTKEQRRLFNRLRRFKPGIERLSADAVNAAAATLGVRREDIVRLEERLGGADAALGDGTGGIRHRDLLGAREPAGDDGIVEVEEAQWHEFSEHALQDALEVMDQRARDIVRRRWLLAGRKPRLKELASEYRLTGERVRQIEERAFDAIRDRLLSR